MISLKTRESISSKSSEAQTSIDTPYPGTHWPGSLLLTLFVTTFCCRYSQTSLLCAVQYNAPTGDWFAPCTSLLLLPAAVLAITAGFITRQKTHSSPVSPLTSTLAILAVGLATISVLLGTQTSATMVVACSIAFIAGCLEVGRLIIWTRILSDSGKNQANSLLVQLVVTEVAATALAVNTFRVAADLMPTIDTVRFSSLLMTATFLLGGFLYSKKKRRPRANATLLVAESLAAEALVVAESMEVACTRAKQKPIWKRYPFSSMFLAIGTNVTAVTLLALTLSSKVVAGIPLSSFWSACAIGMLFGALYCLIPPGKLRTSRLFIALLLSCLSCALCIYKPSGPTLFAGLFAAGFAATITTVTSFCHFLKSDRIASPAVYIGVQTACTCLLGLIIASVLEPRIADLSSFVFIRLLAISQLIFLTSLGSLSYILYKYRRSQG
jgi:hypothetical protein